MPRHYCQARAQQCHQYNLDTFVADPRNAAYLALLISAMNGAVYGAKVRFPHALV